MGEDGDLREQFSVPDYPDMMAMLADNIWRQLGEAGLDIKVDFEPSGRYKKNWPMSLRRVCMRQHP